MRRFKNVLVGVNLSTADRFVAIALPPPSVEAVERAVWLAKRNSARLTFFYAFGVSAAVEPLVVESDGGKDTVLDEDQDVLKELAARAIQAGRLWS